MRSFMDSQLLMQLRFQVSTWAAFFRIFHFNTAEVNGSMKYREQNNFTKDMKNGIKIIGIKWWTVSDYLNVETLIFGECKTNREIVGYIFKIVGLNIQLAVCLKYSADYF